jgi:hypothetical protein
MLQWLTIFTIITCSHIAMGQQVYNAVLSASPSGKYIVAANVKTNSIGLVDLVEKREVKDFSFSTSSHGSNDIQFIIWQSDTTFYYVNEVKSQLEICVYNLNNNTSKMCNVLHKYVFKNMSQEAYPDIITMQDEPFVIYRNAIKEGTSTVYPDTTVLYKFYPLTGKTEKLLNIDHVLGDVTIESIAVNSTGTILLVTTISDNVATLHKINVESQKATIIDTHIDLLHLFFMNNDNWFVYFKDLGTGDNVRRAVLLYDLKNEKTYSLDTLNIGQAPILTVDIPFKKSLLLTYLDLKEPIEMDDPKGETLATKIVKILENWVLGMLDRSHVKEITYKGIISDIQQKD